jgi:hypothetical protein
MNEFYKIINDDTLNLTEKCSAIYNLTPTDLKEIINNKNILYYHPSILKTISLCLTLNSDKIIFDDNRFKIDWKGGDKIFFNLREDKLNRILNKPTN